MNLEPDKTWNSGVALIVFLAALIIGGFLAYLLWALARGSDFVWLPRTRFEWISSLACYGLWILYRVARGN